MEKSALIIPSHKKLLSIQILRGLAATMVVYVHALSNYKDKIDSSYFSTIGFGFGELGVKLFFCISGFIIYTTTKNVLPGGDAVKSFFVKRFIRIVPIYWIFTLLYALKLSFQGQTPLPSELIKSLFFIPYATDAVLMRPVIGQGWTLNYEMFFYVLFGMGLFFSKGSRVLLISISLVALMLLNYSGILNFGESGLLNCLYLLSEHYLSFFLIGIFVAIWFESKKTLFNINEKDKLLLFFIFVIIYVGLLQSSLFSDNYKQLLMVLFCLASLVVAVSGPKNSPNQEIYVTKTSTIRSAFECVGNASYSIYLTHGFFLGLSAKIILKFGLGISPLYFAFLMILICTLLGLFIYKYIEEPLIKSLNSHFIKSSGTR